MQRRCGGHAMRRRRDVCFRTVGVSQTAAQTCSRAAVMAGVPTVQGRSNALLVAGFVVVFDPQVLRSGEQREGAEA